MKKILGIVVLSLLFSGNVFAETFEMKNCRFNNPEIAQNFPGPMNVIINTSSKEIIRTRGSKQHKTSFNRGDLNSGFIYIQKPFATDDKNSYAEWNFNVRQGTIRTKVYSTTIWNKTPKFDDYASSLYNSDCDKNNFATSQVEMASIIDKAKNTCKSLGFKEGTEKFADCSLKLYSQSVQLAAEQNKQVVMQPQSSGSNVITIYDPVRDSNALMNKGMKMLSGKCTLGIDC